MIVTDVSGAELMYDHANITWNAGNYRFGAHNDEVVVVVPAMGPLPLSVFVPTALCR